MKKSWQNQLCIKETLKRCPDFKRKPYYYVYHLEDTIEEFHLDDYSGSSSVAYDKSVSLKCVTRMEIIIYQQFLQSPKLCQQNRIRLILNQNFSNYNKFKISIKRITNNLIGFFQLHGKKMHPSCKMYQGDCICKVLKHNGDS